MGSQGHSLPVLPRLNIPVLVSNGRWWLFSSSSLQPHMHFVAATIFTFTIHSQRVVRLGHCVSELSVGSASVAGIERELESEDVRRGIAPMRGPPLAGKFGAVFPV